MMRLNRPTRGGRASVGQVLVILALVFTVLVGFAGLAIDAGHNYMARRSTQNATDGGALAAGQQLLAAGGQLRLAPTSSDPSVKAAHDFAANNGFNTVYNTACDSFSNSTTQFTTTWFDSGSGGCTRTTGFTNKVTVNDPPCGVAANFSLVSPVSSNCVGIDPQQKVPGDCTDSQYDCFQLVITHRTDNYFLGVFGFGSTYTTTMTVVYAAPPGAVTPPPYSVYLYEPQSGCVAASQTCFTEGTAPSRSNLSCTGGNCPTFWAQPSTRPVFAGVNGNIVTGTPGDYYPAVQSMGDMVFDDNTTFCDPTGSPPLTCPQGTTTGTQGFTTNGTKIYCKQISGTYKSPLDCPSPAVSLGTDTHTSSTTVFGNEQRFTSSTFVLGTVNTANLPHCYGLILNGEQVSSGTWSQTPDPGCIPAAGDEYTLRPGVYSYIVINHGQYSLDAGVFDITGTAPVDTVTSGTANGIDHANEKLPNDWDLCNGGKPNACGGQPGDAHRCTSLGGDGTNCLTAGVWFGNGSLAAAPFNKGTSSTSCGTTSTSGTQAGGGGPTIISGSGVVFRLEPGSGGFVSTNEVQSIQLVSPGETLSGPVEGGTPVLVDDESNSFIHLDDATANTNGPSFSGLLYQPASATGGGVEISSSISSSSYPGLAGQVLAYSFTTFGGAGNGATVDFSNGYGTIGLPPIANSGKNESSLVNKVSALAGDGSGNDIFTLYYTDEWALDAYDSYIQIGTSSANQIFFSQNMWYTPSPSGTLPPEPNGGTGSTIPSGTYASDLKPMYPDTTASSPWPSPAQPGVSYAKAPDSSTGTWSDYTETVNYGSGIAKYEISGFWTWGHQSDLSTATPSWKLPTNYTATVKVTFPQPPGSTVTITMGVYDGDHCGDYAIYQQTFRAPGQPGGGQPTSGSVTIEE